MKMCVEFSAEDISGTDLTGALGPDFDPVDAGKEVWAYILTVSW